MENSHTTIRVKVSTRNTIVSFAKNAKESIDSILERIFKSMEPEINLENIEKFNNTITTKITQQTEPQFDMELYLKEIEPVIRKSYGTFATEDAIQKSLQIMKEKKLKEKL